MKFSLKKNYVKSNYHILRVVIVIPAGSSDTHTKMILSLMTVCNEVNRRKL